MACRQYLNSIHEAVDGTIGAIRRAELDLHVNTCDDCRAMLDDLRRIRDAAAELPDMPVPEAAWLQLAGRLRQEGRVHDEAPRERKRRGATLWLAAAAAVILAVASAAVLLTRQPAPDGEPSRVARAGSGNAATEKTVEPVQDQVMVVEAAQQQFEQAIAGLEKVARANRTVLDAGTSATIDKNLGIIDQAIAENRVAVRAEPASVAARETLFEALRQKVSLLQDTISLINEMRKGNNAGAAQLVNKS